jgi:phosphoglycolate phosphatase-like HAD superfamily hydrolase
VTSTRFDAVIFDFDGTLVASAPAKRQAFFDIFPAAAAQAVEAVLVDDPDGSRHVVIPRMIDAARAHGIALADDDYVTRYGEVSERAVAAAPELPGATALLARLSCLIELHVCSNTPEDTIRRHVAVRGWNPYLKGIDGYPTTKRDRIAAVIAARRLDPSRVAMVGDGISDEEAAAANGCTFFAIRAPEDLMRVGQSLEEHHV